MIAGLPNLTDSGGGGYSDIIDDGSSNDSSSNDSSSNDSSSNDSGSDSYVGIPDGCSNRYCADPNESESGVPGEGAPQTDLTIPDSNENTDNDGVFVDKSGNTYYDPSKDQSGTGGEKSQGDLQDIIDKTAGGGDTTTKNGVIVNPAGDTNQNQPQADPMALFSNLSNTEKALAGAAVVALLAFRGGA